MAASSVISGNRPQHRAPRLDYATPLQDCVALDWNNGLVVNNADSAVFDANRDVAVEVTAGGSSSCVGFWITVGPPPQTGAAGATAKSQWIGANQKPFRVYVPSGQVINCSQVGSGGLLSCIPALTASNN